MARQAADADAARRSSHASAAGTIGSYALLPLAVAGIMAVRRRGTPVYPLLVPAVMVTIASALARVATRFRTAADVAIVILATAALDAVIDRWRRHRVGGSPNAPTASLNPDRVSRA